MRQLHPVTEEHLHVFTKKQQEKIKNMIPCRALHKNNGSQPNDRRMGLMMEFGSTVSDPE